MTTKDVILVVAGVLGGYLLIGFLNKKNSDSSETIVSTASPETNTLVVDQAKIDKCNKEVSDYMMRSRFTKGTNLAEIRKQKFNACMKDNGIREAV
jgi:spore coat protein CotH